MGVVLSGDGSQGKMQEELSPQSQSDLAVGSQEAFGPSLVEILGSLLVSGRLTMFPCSKLPQERLRSRAGWTGRTGVWLPRPRLRRKPTPTVYSPRCI